MSSFGTKPGVIPPKIVDKRQNANPFVNKQTNKLEEDRKEIKRLSEGRSSADSADLLTNYLRKFDPKV